MTFTRNTRRKSERKNEWIFAPSFLFHSHSWPKLPSCFFELNTGWFESDRAVKRRASQQQQQPLHTHHRRGGAPPIHSTAASASSGTMAHQSHSHVCMNLSLLAVLLYTFDAEEHFDFRSWLLATKSSLRTVATSSIISEEFPGKARTRYILPNPDIFRIDVTGFSFISFCVFLFNSE